MIFITLPNTGIFSKVLANVGLKFTVPTITHIDAAIIDHLTTVFLLF